MAPTASCSRGRSLQQVYALVRWITGPKAGTYSHNIDVTWIRGYDPAEPFEESYIVEWRVPPKPRSGWSLFDAAVIDVSDDLDTLSRRKRDLMQAQPQTPTLQQRQPLQDQNVLNSPEFKELLGNIVKSAIGGVGSSPSTPTSVNSCDTENMHKVGEVLLLNRTNYIIAKAAPSGPAMTMGLVRAAFTKARLKRSTYAGQKRTGRNGDVVQKPSLKRFKRMQDIQDFVRSRFPYFSQSSFSQAVNACAGSNVDKKRTRELVDDSDSDLDSN